MKDDADGFPAEIIQALNVMISIFDGIICPFADAEISLKEQFLKLSTLSHVVLYLYRQGGTNFIPGQLYHDLQCVVQGSFFAAATIQFRGGGKLYLYQLGTDQNERLYCSVRTVTHRRNCDSLELCHWLQHAQDINDILAKNLSWKRCHGRRLCGLKRYTSQSEWKGDLEVNDINLHDVWLTGRARAVELLEISDQFFSDLPSGVTMLGPNKRLAGVTVDEDRNENEEEVVDGSLSEKSDDNLEETDEAEAAREIEEVLADVPEPSSSTVYDNKVEYQGKHLFKITIVKNLLGVLIPI